MLTCRRSVVVAALSVAFACVLAHAAPAEAKGKGRKAGKPVAAHKINQRALGELMGPFQFGMTKKKVVSILGRQIKERYQEQIQATNDVYEQDKLRRKQQADVDRISKSYIEFTGKKGSWDVSIIEDQFAHNTGEALLVHWENVDGKDQRRFFFFKDGKLYKMFVALNSAALSDEQRNFEYFKGLMEGRYGKGGVIQATRDGQVVPVALEWRSSKHLVRAIDKLEFYGSFCLMVADAQTEKQLVAARASAAEPKKENTIIKAVITDDKADPSLHENKGALDKILKEN